MDDLERRMELRSQLRNVREVRRCPLEFEMRYLPDGTGGSMLRFTGYASVTCRDVQDKSAAYDMEDALGVFSEQFIRGAFGKTLRDGADVAFLVNHSGITLARTKSQTMRLAEHTEGVPTGLHVEADFDAGNAVVQQVRSGVERGDLDEMSLAFRVTRQEWSEDYSERAITEVNMNQGDVSIVNYGANPHTGGLVGIRSADQLTSERIAAALSALREGTVTAEHRATLALLLRSVAEDDASVDEVIDELINEPEPEPEPTPEPTVSDFEIARAIQRSRELERKHMRKSA